MVDEDVFRAVPFFVDLDSWVISALARQAEEVRLGSAELIIVQNEDARDVYFLLDGSIEVLLRYEGVGELFMGTHEQVGTLIGWSAFQLPHRYSDSVRCHRPSRLLRVPSAAFEEVMSGDPAVGYQLLRRVNAQVAQQLETTRQLIDAAPDQTQEL
jgi:CRP-like cAMP-binding protein